MLKDRCVGSVVPDPIPYDGRQYSQACYSDVYVLYFARNLAIEPVPYVNGDGEFDNEVAADGSRTEIGDLEYPAGTGLVVAVVALLVQDARAFFLGTSILLALAGVAVFVSLRRIAADRRRLFLFAAAPSLVLYAFHNWDLIAVAFACAGFVAFARRRDGAAGALLGVGAAVKVFPGLLLPGFVLARWLETGERHDHDEEPTGRRRLPWAMLGGAIAAFALINLPFALANPAGWWAPWDFQSTRFPNYDNVWFVLYERARGLVDGSFWFDTYPRLTGVLSALLFVLGALALLRAESRRERVRPFVTAFGLLLVFLLTAKVFSPQYALWVLPFFVLVRVPVPLFVAFAVTEAAVWFAVGGYFIALAGRGDADLRLTIMEVAVVARALVLGVLLWHSRRSEDRVTAPAAGRSPARA